MSPVGSGSGLGLLEPDALAPEEFVGGYVAEITPTLAERTGYSRTSA
jgi:hypothetical protein